MSARDDLTDLLRTTWSDIDELVSDLSPGEWSHQVLPGWDVKDTLAHVIGTEKMLQVGTEDMRDRVSAAGADENPAASHVRNAIGRTNEEWVEHFRSVEAPDVIAEFREVTADRLKALESMSDADFASSSWTPAGEGSYESFMRIRLFDCWMHEHDIRYAVGRRRDEGGPAAEESLAQVVGALGYVVGKRAKAPTGSVVKIELTGPIERSLHVEVADRARVVDQPSKAPDTALRLGSALFMRLAGGRVAYSQVARDVEIDGDTELGARVADNLAFTV